MAKEDQIVAVGLFTKPEFDLWRHKLRQVYLLDHADQFEDLLHAIDEADKMQRGDEDPDR